MTWPPTDQAKALAWMVDQADKCPGCGTRSYEADEFQPVTITCRVCRDVEIHKAEVFDSRSSKKPGRMVYLKRRDNGS